MNDVYVFLIVREQCSIVTARVNFKYYNAVKRFLDIKRKQQLNAADLFAAFLNNV